jgi:hypothetical protein
MKKLMIAGIAVSIFLILSVQSISAIEYDSVEDAIKNKIPELLQNSDESMPTCLITFFPIATVIIVMILGFIWRLFKFGLTLTIIAAIVGTILRVIDEE